MRNAIDHRYIADQTVGEANDDSRRLAGAWLFLLEQGLRPKYTVTSSGGGKVPRKPWGRESFVRPYGLQQVSLPKQLRGYVMNVKVSTA